MTYLIQNPFQGIKVIRELVAFTRSSAIGGNLEKILIRIADLVVVFDHLPSKQVVCEFGSGSSTIFFLTTKKVSKTYSFEEFEEFLPKFRFIDAKAWYPRVGKTITEIVSEVPIPRFYDISDEIRFSSILYIDGPATPKDPEYQLAFANTEVLSETNLESHIVLVDCRLLTVFQFALALGTSHHIYPSEASLHDLQRLIERDPKKGNEIKRVLSPRSQELKPVSIGPCVRTSIFLPKLK